MQILSYEDLINIASLSRSVWFTFMQSLEIGLEGYYRALK